MDLVQTPSTMLRMSTEFPRFPTTIVSGNIHSSYENDIENGFSEDEELKQIDHFTNESFADSGAESYASAPDSELFNNTETFADAAVSCPTTSHCFATVPSATLRSLDEHFMNKLNQTLTDTLTLQDNINSIDALVEFGEPKMSMYYRSDSPITISNYDSNSISNSDSEEDHSYIRRLNHKPKYKTLTFHDIEQSLSQYYSTDNKFSSEIDILATYLKGQKNIYIQSKFVCQRKLNILTIPALTLTAAIVVFAPFTEEYHWGGIFISTINAVIALLLSMISYFKIESALEMYIYLAKQFEKMELSLELTNNKVLFIESVEEQEKIMLPKIREIENKISDIKESHLSILIPEEVKLIFPIICHINILSFIKKIEVYKRNLIIQFKDIKNEIRYIRFKSSDNLCVGTLEREKIRLPVLIAQKEKIREELLHYKQAYGYIDEIFTREIKYAEHLNRSWMCYRKAKPVYEYSNPVIKELLQSVFGDE